MFLTKVPRLATYLDSKSISTIWKQSLSSRLIRVRSTMASFPATFMRGGTSNGLVINRVNLPKDEVEWQPILSSAMGSPDGYGRQLNGMGSGISSTSKVCVISKSARQDADVDFTFVQVGIKDGSLDMAGNCGNMSSTIGPMALHERFVDKPSGGGGEMNVKIFNTSTSKIVHSTFSVNERGEYEPNGDYSVDGVPSTGSKITMSFLDPAGSKTGKALPTGNATDILGLPDGSSVSASLVDVANPVVFVLASDVGVAGDIAPDALQANTDVVNRLEHIRQAGAQRMGLDPNIQSIPKIVLISAPSCSATDGVNIVCRALSMQQPHKAVPLTIALNLGVACNLPGTLPALTAVGAEGKDSVVIEHASGKIEVGSVMKDGKIESALLHRTARVLMKGDVFYTVDEDR